MKIRQKIIGIMTAMVCAVSALAADIPLIAEAVTSAEWGTEVIESLTQTGEYEYELGYDSRINLEFIPAESGEYEIVTSCPGKYHSFTLNEKDDEGNETGTSMSGVDYIGTTFFLSEGTSYLIEIDSLYYDFIDDYNWTEGETETLFLTVSKVEEVERETITKTGKYEYQLGYDSAIYLNYIPEETGSYMIETESGGKFCLFDFYGVSEEDWVGWSTIGTDSSNTEYENLTAGNSYYINISSLIADAYEYQEYNWTEGETQTFYLTISKIERETITKPGKYEYQLGYESAVNLNFVTDESGEYRVSTVCEGKTHSLNVYRNDVTGTGFNNIFEYFEAGENNSIDISSKSSNFYGWEKEFINWTEGETQTVYLTISKIERETVNKPGKYEYQLGYDSPVNLEFVPEKPGEYGIMSYCEGKIHEMSGDISGDGINEYNIYADEDGMNHIDLNPVIPVAWEGDFNYFEKGETVKAVVYIYNLDEETVSFSELSDYSFDVPASYKKKLTFDVAEEGYYTLELSNNAGFSLEGNSWSVLMTDNVCEIFLEKDSYSIIIGQKTDIGSDCEFVGPFEEKITGANIKLTPAENCLYKAPFYYEKIDSDNDGVFDYAEIIRCDVEITGSIEIPAAIDGIPVQLIGSSAFNSMENLTEVIIPESVEMISWSAFDNCTSLKAITIKNPECDIYGGDGTISNNATIYGYTNSESQKYAEAYGKDFVSIGEYNPGIIKGDVNDDGKVNILDVIGICRYVMGAKQFTAEEQERADYNADGKVNILDAIAIAATML